MQFLLWTVAFAKPVMIDLGTLGGESEAVAISNNGQVIGNSRLPDNTQHGFIWENGKMTDLGSFGCFSEVTAINNKGQVLGNSFSTDGAQHGFIWESGKMTDLGTFGGNATQANAINENGQVVGMSELADGSYHGFIWENGKMTDLGTLGGDFSEAVSINNNGQVLGDSYIDNRDWHGFIWQNGKMIDIGPSKGDCTPVSINDKGQAIGYTLTSGDDWHAFIWNNAHMSNLEILGNSDPRAINKNGQVVGYYANSIQHGFIWSNYEFTDLGTLGGRYSSANAINENGQVVGQSYLADGTHHGFIWQDSKMIDLGTLGGYYSTAVAINEKGQVVGNSDLGSEHASEHAFIWYDDGTPVITISPYNSSPINNDITVTASVDKGTLNETSHTFSENGNFTFIATNEAGSTSKTVTITNIDKTLSPVPTVNPSEIHVDVTSSAGISLSIGHNTLASLMNGTGKLVPNVDYKVSGNAVTINKSYLDYYFTKFPDHNLYLNFNFDSGMSSVLTVYTGETPHVVLTNSLYIQDSSDAKLYLIPNGNFITSIKNGGSSLVQRIDYTYDPSTHILYIRKGYLNSYFSNAFERLYLTVYFTGDTPKTVVINNPLNHR